MIYFFIPMWSKTQRPAHCRGPTKRGKPDRESTPPGECPIPWVIRVPLFRPRQWKIQTPSAGPKSYEHGWSCGPRSSWPSAMWPPALQLWWAGALVIPYGLLAWHKGQDTSLNQEHKFWLAVVFVDEEDNADGPYNSRHAQNPFFEHGILDLILPIFGNQFLQGRRIVLRLPLWCPGARCSPDFRVMSDNPCHPCPSHALQGYTKSFIFLTKYPISNIFYL